MEKELKDISWLVDEPTYRLDPALSYSTLSRYEREGFDKLDHLFDSISTPSLLSGSVLDVMMTGGEDEFHRLFQVLDVNITDGGKDVCNQLISLSLPYESFEEIPELIVSNAAKEAGFWKDNKWDSRRYKEVLKTGNIAEYYNALINTDKTIISTETFNEALAMVKALREAPATSGYFADNDELSPIRRYYQLKFKAVLEGVGYRCMADEIICDYERKEIYLIDLKTSSKPEWDFYKSFIEWNYSCQARLYYRIIAANLLKDEYFRDFKIHNYRFIVVNKRTLQPLVWEFEDTKKVGILKYGKKEQIEIRDPFTIGKELRQYLDLKPLVPNGIRTKGTNNIVDFLKTI